MKVNYDNNENAGKHFRACELSENERKKTYSLRNFHNETKTLTAESRYLC